MLLQLGGPPRDLELRAGGNYFRVALPTSQSLRVSLEVTGQEGRPIDMFVSLDAAHQNPTSRDARSFQFKGKIDGHVTKLQYAHRVEDEDDDVKLRSTLFIGLEGSQVGDAFTFKVSSKRMLLTVGVDV